MIYITSYIQYYSLILWTLWDYGLLVRLGSFGETRLTETYIGVDYAGGPGTGVGRFFGQAWPIPWGFPWGTPISGCLMENHGESENVMNDKWGTWLRTPPYLKNCRKKWKMLKSLKPWNGCALIKHCDWWEAPALNGHYQFTVTGNSLD